MRRTLSKNCAGAAPSAPGSYQVSHGPCLITAIRRAHLTTRSLSPRYFLAARSILLQCVLGAEKAALVHVGGPSYLMLSCMHEARGNRSIDQAANGGLVLRVQGRQPDGVAKQLLLGTSKPKAFSVVDVVAKKCLSNKTEGGNCCECYCFARLQ